jgi:hypothetical protein
LEIDKAAAAARLSETDLRAWAQGQRVFISSVMAELSHERAAVAKAISEFGADAVWFEDFGGRDDDAQIAYLGEVRTCSVYLGILDHTYGRIQLSRLSATHEEYREAERAGLRMCVWVRDGNDFLADQAAFVQEVQVFHTTGHYVSADDLTQGVISRLAAIAAEEMSPWIKLGSIMLRAKSVEDDGQLTTIKASIHGPAIAHAVEQLRPRVSARNSEARLTYGWRSYGVRVVSVTTRTSTSRATLVTVVLERGKSQPSAGMSISYNLGGRQYSADDLVEYGLRRHLFGEHAPHDLHSMGGDVEDPLSELSDAPMSDDLFRATLGLGITEALIWSGRARRIEAIRISPSGSEGRRILIRWTGIDQNDADPVREVTGVLRPRS